MIVKESDLTAKLEEYIDFLGDEIGRTASYLHVHGMHTSPESIAKGDRLRAEIDALKQELGYDQKQAND